MALKIRLRQQGRHNRPFFRLVLADSRSPRDGKYIEMLGWYNPFETEETRYMNVNSERVQYWLDQGAQISESVVSLLRKTAPAVVKELSAKRVQAQSKLTAQRRAWRGRRKQASA